MVASTYAQEVVHPGDRASAYAAEVCRESFGNSSAVHVVPHQPGNFRGPVGFVWRSHIVEMMLETARQIEAGKQENWSVLEEPENDGAGGKPQFFSLLGTSEVMRGLGWEIITMCADDLARTGRFPAVMVNDIQAKLITKANFPLFQAVMDGYGSALRAARLVNITGEVAIMKNSITAFCDTGDEEQLVLTWGGVCLGVARSDRLLDPQNIRPGMAVVGFLENGYRCNGGTFFTNVMRAQYGSDPDALVRNHEARAFAAKLCVPSVSYAAAVTSLLGWLLDGSITTPRARVYGIAHITGGGVWGKFGELLPEGVGARLDAMPHPAEVMLQAQEFSRGTVHELSDWDGYGNLNGGIGMLVVCHFDDVGKVLTCAETHGIRAQYVGATTRCA
ncbi:MAG: AIR synthase-related protein, partial [Patescibacteria group bacterium]|nr:AIR synthase-related protein [Patescibacteria group bacterium]